MKTKDTYIKREVVKEYATGYVAYDGATFGSAQECCVYEIKLLYRELQENPDITFNEEATDIYNLDNGGQDIDLWARTFYWVQPINSKGCDWLNNIQIMLNGEMDYIFRCGDINKWFCIEIKEDNLTCIYRLQDSIDVANTLLEKFGYKVVKGDNK